MQTHTTTVVDLIEVAHNGIVQVRSVAKIAKDGVESFAGFHRHTIAPGVDYSQEDDRVQSICAATHTPEVIAAYKAANAAKGV